MIRELAEKIGISEKAEGLTRTTWPAQNSKKAIPFWEEWQRNKEMALFDLQTVGILELDERNHLAEIEPFQP